MYVEDLIAELGQRIGIKDLKLEEDGTCRLIFDKKYVVDMEASEDKRILHVYAVVGEIPSERKEQLYESLLAANLFGKGTGFAAFGIDNDKGEILLWANLLVEALDVETFIQFLEDFVSRVEFWQEKLASGFDQAEDEVKEQHLNFNQFLKA